MTRPALLKKALFAFMFFSMTLAHAEEDVVNGLYGSLFFTGSGFEGLRMYTYRPQFINYQNNPHRPFGAIIYDRGTIQSRFGGGGGTSLGYRYNCFRLEGEFLANFTPLNNAKYAMLNPEDRDEQLSFRRSKTTANEHRQAYVSGQTGQYVGFLNLFYDFLPSHPSDHPWYPYLGLGMGYQKMLTTVKFKAQDWGGISATPQFSAQTTKQITIYSIDKFPPPPPCPDGDNTCLPPYMLAATQVHSNNFVGQGILGLGYQMDSYFNFFLDFRYLATPKIKALDESLHWYTLNFGMTYSFCNL